MAKIRNKQANKKHKNLVAPNTTVDQQEISSITDVSAKWYIYFGRQFNNFLPSFA